MLQQELTEDDIIKMLPSKSQALETMRVTYLLSDGSTNALGDFEVQYAFDPVSTAALKR